MVDVAHIPKEAPRGHPRRSIVTARVDPAAVCHNYLRRSLVERVRFHAGSFDLPWYRRRGGWDRRCQPFEGHPTFRLLAAYYHSGFDPAATGRYHELMARVGQGGGGDLASEEDVARYFKRLRGLFESLARDGYLSGRARDEIGVAVSRSGKLIKVANGNHRMAVACLLGLDEVTVELRFVHERWYRRNVPRTREDFRTRIAAVLPQVPGVLAVSQEDVQSTAR